MANKKAVAASYESTKVPGVRKTKRGGRVLYEALYTKYLGAFETIGEAQEAREKFVAKVTPSKEKEVAKKKTKSAQKNGGKRNGKAEAAQAA